MKKILFSGAVLLTALSIQAEDKKVDFVKDIQPILEERCTYCHGNRKQKGDFRLDNLKDMLSTGDSAPKNVIPGKPAESYLVKLISMTEDDDDIMPPKGDPLKKEQIAKIKAWIADGAKWLDVRLPSEFESSHEADAINIPLYFIRLKLTALDEKTQILSGLTSGERVFIDLPEDNQNQSLF